MIVFDQWVVSQGLLLIFMPEWRVSWVRTRCGSSLAAFEPYKAG